jgi:coenzyme F420-reducing hydrogenase beta subunit
MLRIMLGLPGHPVEIRAVPVRYIELEEEEDREQARYLIGMIIKEMSPSHRSQYNAFLKSLQ